MTVSVLLDTSFLITLVDSQRRHHAVAKSYYQHMLQVGIPMHFSSVVAAEFAVKQDLVDLPLSNFRKLNFNLAHAHRAGQYWNAIGQRDNDDGRHVVRDDVKLLAQAGEEAIDFLITEDVRTLYKYCERLRSAGQLSTRAIALRDGFQPSALNPSGQTDWVENESVDL